MDFSFCQPAQSTFCPNLQQLITTQAQKQSMCVIYGHRNRTHLRILETVEAGDSITTTLSDGSEYTYVVTRVQAFEDSGDLEIPTLDGKSIVLITCYPFHYSGSAPGKCLVVGQFNTEVAE